MSKKQRTDQATNEAVKTITITLPIGDLIADGGYQQSRSHLPRQLRSRRVTPEEAIALCRLRLGFLAIGETLDAPRRDFFTGAGRSVPVESKEQVVSRLLEICFNAMEQAEA